jgi:hypothetical protein
MGHWHAHGGRHTAASIMSSNGVTIQDISDTLGHKSTHVTGTVYRHVIVPEIRGGAIVIDGVFNDGCQASTGIAQSSTTTNTLRPEPGCQPELSDYLRRHAPGRFPRYSEPRPSACNAAM